MGQFGIDEVVEGSIHVVGQKAPLFKVLDADSFRLSDLLP